MLVAAILLAGPAACQTLPQRQATLAPTLTLQGQADPIAYQDGIPVPSFSTQPGPSLDLDGSWRFQPAVLDTTLTLRQRSRSLGAIEQRAAGRQKVGYDDASWSTLAVPGSFDGPPNQRGGGGWYRHTFDVPSAWKGDDVTLKFGAASYVADVWINGVYEGYHEGGQTPFAFDVSKALRVGRTNTIAVRVDSPAWGTRNDIMPWGLADWWDYGGLVGSVWLQAQPPLHLVRDDIVPHLDGADLSVVVDNADRRAQSAQLLLQLLPAAITPKDLLDPDAASLVPAGADPIVQSTVNLGQLSAGEVTTAAHQFLLRDVDLWAPGNPALYVARAALEVKGQVIDEEYESFGLRRISVDSSFPRLLLNSKPIAFRGVAVHDELSQAGPDGEPVGGPMTTAAEVLAQLRQVQSVHADLVRADHEPPEAWLPLLADRLGIAVWEEIPLYHNTPQTFQILMNRGLPQQMLTEMDLRDFNDPSVLFHGLANESTGGSVRASALDQLQQLDHRIDGTRLDGQASYGYDPTDDTSASLDVVGVTFYWGVFYGGPISSQLVARELARLHRTYPRKPIMIMEYGVWADNPSELPHQERVFAQTYKGISPSFDDLPGGYVGAAVWWSLDDYWSEQRPGIRLEHFGLFNPDGTERPAGQALSAAYAESAPPAAGTVVQTGGQGVSSQPAERQSRVLVSTAYALGLPAAVIVLLILALAFAPRVRLRRRHP